MARSDSVPQTNSKCMVEVSQRVERGSESAFVALMIQC